MTSGLLIPLNTDKMKKKGWLDDSGQLSIAVDEKQHGANRLFTHDNHWYVLYHSGSPLTTAPLVYNWKVVAEDFTLSKLTPFIRALGGAVDKTVVYRENDETMDTEFHADYQQGESFAAWWDDMIADWGDAEHYLHSVQFKIASPVSQHTLYRSGTWFLQMSGEMDVAYIDNLLTKAGYKSDDAVLAEAEISKKKNVPHPLSKLGHLIDHLSDTHNTLPPELQNVLSNGLYEELREIQRGNEGRRRYV